MISFFIFFTPLKRNKNIILLYNVQQNLVLVIFFHPLKNNKNIISLYNCITQSHFHFLFFLPLHEKDILKKKVSAPSWGNNNPLFIAFKVQVSIFYSLNISIALTNYPLQYIF